MARLSALPVSYAIAGRRVLLAGDGERILQKARFLLRSAAAPALFAPDPAPELRDFAGNAGWDLAARMPGAEDLAGCALAFVGSDDPMLESAVAALARAARVPVNVVDRPDLSDFAVPAIVLRPPIAIAISTDGAAPVLAQRIRAAIERLLPPGLGHVAELAATLRATVRAQLPASRARRDFWAGLFDGEAAAAALAGDTARARRLAMRALDTATAAPPAGKVYLVGAGPGASDLLTLRAQRLLQDADVVVHDDLVPEEVLDMARRDARRIAVGKRKGRDSAKQTHINALLVDLAQDGLRVVRLKSGDPAIFGRAGEELDALRAAGITAELVPGVTAACAAAADLGMSLTRRGTSSQLIFVTGHDARGATPEGWEAQVAAGATAALYMGRSVADRVTARLREAGASLDLPAIAIENAGRVGRRVLAGTLGELAALAARTDLDGPVLVLVGAALAEADVAAAESLAQGRYRRIA
jgi:uroporphyrin-III C-methyltransferase/precorrin-2 dehydrogenase/sirohydrochlorin ferrochelatase